MGDVLWSVIQLGVNMSYRRDSIIIVMVKSCNYPAVDCNTGTRARSHSEFPVAYKELELLLLRSHNKWYFKR